MLSLKYTAATKGVGGGLGACLFKYLLSFSISCSLYVLRMADLKGIASSCGSDSTSSTYLTILFLEGLISLSIVLTVGILGAGGAVGVGFMLAISISEEETEANSVFGRPKSRDMAAVSLDSLPRLLSELEKHILYRM